LRRFAEFLSLLTFNRAAEGSRVVPFTVPRDSIMIEQPDDIVDLKFPSIAFLAGTGTIDPLGLGAPQLLEETLDRYGDGTAIVLASEYSERFTLEMWASSRAERRALVAGTSVALRGIEESYALRLSLPDYFDQVAEFSLEESRLIDDPDAVRNRRRAHLLVNMRMPEVFLVNVERFRALASLEEIGTTVDVRPWPGCRTPR